MNDLRTFSTLPLEHRLADVCPVCGLHSVSDLQDRSQRASDGSVGSVYECCFTTWVWLPVRLLLAMWGLALHAEAAD